jgi:hypothetical protein
LLPGVRGPQALAIIIIIMTNNKICWRRKIKTRTRELELDWRRSGHYEAGVGHTHLLITEYRYLENTLSINLLEHQ